MTLRDELFTAFVVGGRIDRVIYVSAGRIYTIGKQWTDFALGEVRPPYGPRRCELTRAPRAWTTQRGG